MQDGNRDTEVENRHVSMKRVGKKTVGQIEKVAHMCVCIHTRELHSVLCSDLNGKESQRVDVCMCMADSLPYAVENNTTL